MSAIPSEHWDNGKAVVRVKSHKITVRFLKLKPRKP